MQALPPKISNDGMIGTGPVHVYIGKAMLASNHQGYTKLGLPARIVKK